MNTVRKLKWWIGLVLMLMLVLTNSTNAEESSDYDMQPVITQAYEQGPGIVYVEWSGTAPSYQVYVDGKHVKTVDVPITLIDVQKGAHTIIIIPACKKDGSDVNLGLAGFEVGFNMSEISTGTPSKPLSIDYIPDPLYSTALMEPIANMNLDDSILLSFTDNYGSDEYLVTVKSGNDTSYVRYSPNDGTSDVGYNTDDDTRNELISIDGSLVTLRLDPVYLKENDCIQPQFDKTYTLSVQLRKYAVSMLNGEKITSVIHESKVSKELIFTPINAWRVAPIITMAKQTDEGQVTLQWTHNPGDYIACDYDVLLINKVLGIKTAETLAATVTSKEAVLQDLSDGDYTYTIVTRYEGNRGMASGEVNVTVKNTWNEEPKLMLSQLTNNQVKLEWAASIGVKTYHIRVYAGDSKSLLSFADLDYKLYKEFVIPLDGDMLNTTFSYDGEIDPEKGAKLKFEIWGIKRAQDGTELNTKTGSASITLKPAP